eukprot:TRINITY_DN63943_c0_g1_i1.p1 TRINITY_DN63943_c0_g1~~TRINITY_DN63943_c0_g1_i1.p1  ORF type:complete len:614 (+),score=81.82 TRINITY_DN63943_c0_g1_i1:254-1843(+)
MVGDYFYLVSSSFEYFPGIPIHRSKDLVNWDLIGYGLHRAEQVVGKINLVDVNQDDGVQAATIRYKDGVFYIVATWSTLSGEAGPWSFIITATDAQGPWSLPHIIDGAPGIDPSLLFDDDGKVWYTANHDTAAHNVTIWAQELDIQTLELIGHRHVLSNSGSCHGVWVEGPHLYKYANRYYLITAEGGTGLHHSVMVAASDNITGPYVNNPRNPVLTMRHVSASSWVTRVGHADMLELPDGRWVAVVLGVRGEVLQNVGNRTKIGSSNMGRESHLLPMVWEYDDMSDEGGVPPYLWPVLSPETGRLDRTYPLPMMGTSFQPANSYKDEFNTDILDVQWNFRRLPANGTYSLSQRKGFLRLYARPQVIAPRGNCSLLGIRQLESEFEFTANMEFSPDVNGVEAGIMLFQKDDDYIKFVLVRNSSTWILQLLQQQQDKDPILFASSELTGYNGKISLQVKAKRDAYSYTYCFDSAECKTLTETPSDLLLYVGYTGNYLGLYATSNGQSTEAFVDFDSVEHTAYSRVPAILK